MNFMNSLGDSLQSGLDGAKTRVNTAKAGKDLLNDPTKEAEIYAINAMRAARWSDDAVSQKLNEDVKQYEEAVKAIRKALAAPPTTTAMRPARVDEYKKLLKQYEARLKNTKEAARAMAAVKPALPIANAEEEDACKILWVKLIGKPSDKPPIMASDSSFR